jgi:hypothetical protein
MIIDALDVRPHARRGPENVAHEREIDVVVGARIFRRVHQLHRQIDALGRRIGALDGEDVLLAKDRDLTFDQETGALVVVGDDALAENDPFARLELDLERHRPLRGFAEPTSKANSEWPSPSAIHHSLPQPNSRSTA